MLGELMTAPMWMGCLFGLKDSVGETEPVMVGLCDGSAEGTALLGV
jgi:hypothetical protein